MRSRVTARTMRFSLEVAGPGVISLATATAPRCGSLPNDRPTGPGARQRCIERGSGASGRQSRRAWQLEVKCLAELRRFYRYTNARKRAHIERFA